MLLCIKSLYKTANKIEDVQQLGLPLGKENSIWLLAMSCRYKSVFLTVQVLWSFSLTDQGRKYSQIDYRAHLRPYSRSVDFSAEHTK